MIINNKEESQKNLKIEESNKQIHDATDSKLVQN